MPLNRAVSLIRLVHVRLSETILMEAVSLFCVVHVRLSENSILLGLYSWSM